MDRGGTQVSNTLERRELFYCYSCHRHFDSSDRSFHLAHNWEQV